MHELGHATGHHTRLNRDLSGAFGSQSYALEELRAETYSFIQSFDLGIELNLENHASYLDSWAKTASTQNGKDEIRKAIKDALEINKYVKAQWYPKDMSLDFTKTIQGDKILNSDIVVYDGKERTLTTKSSAVIHEPEYTISSDEDMVHNLDTKQMNLTNAAFILNGSVISGTADKMNIDNKKGSKTYKGATISGCPVDKRSWHFYSTTFKTEKDAYFGDAWNDVLFLGKVPVFYTPYAQIPLTNKRHSGLLPVSLEYKSGEGISYTAPFYLNLATNYDATVTPGHDAKRGNIYDVQFRYLPFNNLSGEINATYLPNDPHWSPKNDDYSRWFINIYQTLSFLENDLNFSLDYSKVRNDDYTYLSDVSQKNAAITNSSSLHRIK